VIYTALFVRRRGPYPDAVGKAPAYANAGRAGSNYDILLTDVTQAYLYWQFVLTVFVVLANFMVFTNFTILMVFAFPNAFQFPARHFPTHKKRRGEFEGSSFSHFCPCGFRWLLCGLF